MRMWEHAASPCAPSTAPPSRPLLHHHRHPTASTTHTCVNLQVRLKPIHRGGVGQEHNPQAVVKVINVQRLMGLEGLGRAALRGSDHGILCLRGGGEPSDKREASATGSSMGNWHRPAPRMRPHGSTTGCFQTLFPMPLNQRGWARHSPRHAHQQGGKQGCAMPPAPVVQSGAALAPERSPQGLKLPRPGGRGMGGRCGAQSHEIMHHGWACHAGTDGPTHPTDETPTQRLAGRELRDVVGFTRRRALGLGAWLAAGPWKGATRSTACLFTREERACMRPTRCSLGTCTDRGPAREEGVTSRQHAQLSNHGIMFRGM